VDIELLLSGLGNAIAEPRRCDHPRKSPRGAAQGLHAQANPQNYALWIELLDVQKARRSVCMVAGVKPGHYGMDPTRSVQRALLFALAT
jgi:hypothetical protein